MAAPFFVTEFVLAIDTACRTEVLQKFHWDHIPGDEQVCETSIFEK